MLAIHVRIDEKHRLFISTMFFSDMLDLENCAERLAGTIGYYEQICKR